MLKETNTLELPEETWGNMWLLCDVNDGSGIAEGLKVMNNSHYFPIWRMTAVLKVNLIFEVETERCTWEIESG